MRINPERSRAIFGNPPPPSSIWEQQFDYHNKKLRAIGKKPWREISEEDLGYYLPDLAYVELQPDLFAHLFPVCLNFWYDTLMTNREASRDSEFHSALRHGDILDKMLTSDQKAEVLDFFCDGFLDRIEHERGFIYSGSSTPAYGWIYRFNSLALIAPLAARIWLEWWKLDHPGKAVSGVMYLSGLVYQEGENPIFGVWTPEGGGGGPYLAENDASIYDAGWLPENIAFLQSTLTASYVQEQLHMAAESLLSQSEYEIACKVAHDSITREAIIKTRLDRLMTALKSTDSHSILE